MKFKRGDWVRYRDGAVFEVKAVEGDNVVVRPHGLLPLEHCTRWAPRQGDHVEWVCPCGRHGGFYTVLDNDHGGDVLLHPKQIDRNVSRENIMPTLAEMPVKEPNALPAE
jgi:hypothetical protein